MNTDADEMVTMPFLRVCLVTGALALLAVVPREGIPSAAAPPAFRPDAQTEAARDGSHDFDFEIGTWKTHLRRRLHPLSASSTWVEYTGTTVVRKVWNGKANLVELEVEGSAGRIEGLSLRLYDPVSHQWSLNFSNSSAGTLARPTIGSFHGRRGEFYDQETFEGRAIFDRFVITEVARDTCRFEQAFSDDGGKTWETNWVATDVRVIQGAPNAP